MIKIEYPEPDFKIEKRGGVHKIFDVIRKIWCVLTPEEWVRQNILAFITKVMHYPSSLLSIEKEILLGELKKRVDILVYNKQMLPWMMIECKEKNVVLDEKVLDQILRYHLSVPVPYLLITNGEYGYCFKKTNGVFREINELPAYGAG